MLLTTLLRASLVAAASAAPLRLSRIYGLFPREPHIQDFWGPVSDGFKATFEYEAYYQAMSDDEVGEAIDAFLSPGRPFHVLLISYESLKLHVAKLSASATACDLLVCDEAQRLKGRKTQLSAALGSLRCARRILLTGTPVQNDLDEFFALADFANPGVLGTPDAFRKTFDAPIAKGLLRGAAPGDVKLAQDRQKILSLIAGRFLLRRENKLNAAHLPPKLVQVLVCRPAAPQRRAIAALLGEKRLQHALAGKQADVLAYIGRYKKICDLSLIHI